VIDLFTRERLAIDIGQGLSGRDVVASLERLRFERGLPQRVYCDNGTEFVSAAMDLRAYTNGVILDFSRRGKPTDNATIESFNGRFRGVFERALVRVAGGRAAEDRRLSVGLQ
jgi:putative transposase